MSHILRPCGGSSLVLSLALGTEFLKKLKKIQTLLIGHAGVWVKPFFMLLSVDSYHVSRGSLAG